MSPVSLRAPHPKRRGLSALLATFALVSGFGFAGVGRAQPPAGGAQPPVIDLGEEFRIEGRVQKPEAFYFLRRTPFGYVIRSLDQDFLDEVVRSVERAPF